ncbi:MAG: hypothetical protein SGPRY_004285 [Prymnesium sp.]
MSVRQRSSVLSVGAGWGVPLGPEEYLKKLLQGHLLTAHEMACLRNDAEIAAQLEETDPGFARASRKWRAHFAEEWMIEETRQKIVEKRRNTESVMRRQALKLARKREERERKMERGAARRVAVNTELERQRQQRLERFALDDRRALVRETIQRALTCAQGSGSHAERRTFAHPSMLSDTPGPGKYEAVTGRARATTFASHPATKVLKKEETAPGPGAYNPKRLDHIGKEPGQSFGAITEPRRRISAPGPGPGAYDCTTERKPGGSISNASIKTDVEVLIAMAREMPGPGEYYTDKSLSTGRQSSISGRTTMPDDLQLEYQKRAPGPGSYDLPGHRIRGGLIVDEPQHVSLPPIRPGPGSYHQTPTVKQELELRKLSKQVPRYCCSTLYAIWSLSHNSPCLTPQPAQSPAFLRISTVVRWWN